MFAQGTEADGAGVDVVQVPAQVSCDACGHVAETLDLLAVCPACQSPEVTIAGGDELTLESITYARAAATGQV